MLLDISNPDEYIWTNDFVLSPTSPATSLAIIIGTIIGSLFGGALFAFGSFSLYKWNKKRRKQKELLSIPHCYSYC